MAALRRAQGPSERNAYHLNPLKASLFDAGLSVLATPWIVIASDADRPGDERACNSA